MIDLVLTIGLLALGALLGAAGTVAATVLIVTRYW